MLLTISGYRFSAKDVDRAAEVTDIRAGLPSVRHVVHVPYGVATSPTWSGGMSSSPVTSRSR